MKRELPLNHRIAINMMQTLPLPEQIAVVEDVLTELGLAATADVLALSSMSILLDIYEGNYPDELVARARKVAEQVRSYNLARFGASRGN